MIELKHVSKRFDSHGPDVVCAIDLHVREGEMLVLLGESGCGKTTTLKMINRLIEPTQGSIIVNGQDVRHVERSALRRSIGYVFQGVGLFPHMTVGQNIGIGPSLLRWPREKIGQRELKLTTVMVTHDMMEALLCADRIAVMLGESAVEMPAYK